MIKISVLLHMSKMIQLYIYAVNKNLNFSGQQSWIFRYFLTTIGTESNISSGFFAKHLLSYQKIFHKLSYFLKPRKKV